MDAECGVKSAQTRYLIRHGYFTLHFLIVFRFHSAVCAYRRPQCILKARFTVQRHFALFSLCQYLIAVSGSARLVRTLFHNSWIMQGRHREHCNVIDNVNKVQSIVSNKVRSSRWPKNHDGRYGHGFTRHDICAHNNQIGETLQLQRKYRTECIVTHYGTIISWRHCTFTVGFRYSLCWLCGIGQSASRHSFVSRFGRAHMGKSNLKPEAMIIRDRNNC
jgi:hypothetical protein